MRVISRAFAITAALLTLSSCGGDDEADPATPTIGEQATTAVPEMSTPSSASTTTNTTTTTTTIVSTTTTERHTGTVESCTEGKAFIDPDDDGWGVCVTPTTTNPPNTIARDTALAVQRCIDANTIGMGAWVTEFDDTTKSKAAMDLCDEASTFLEVDRESEIGGPISELALKISERNLALAKINFLVTIAASGSASDEGLAQIDAAREAVDQGYFQWDADMKRLLAAAR